MAKRKIPDNIRQLCYERDQGACQEPGCQLTRQNGGVMNLHHIQPEQFGGQETPSNLITLCDIHHKNMHSEFSAFYPDSQNILRRMNTYMQKTLSEFRSIIKIDDGLDLRPYLKLLTGQDDFRLGQLEVIRAAKEGRNVLFVTPTGAGKSLCYQLPGLLSSQPALVISPLKALMKDQVESIWRKKIPATYINGDISLKERQNRYQFILKDLYKFIFIAPERFKSKEVETSTLYRQYSYFVVDEAHEIETWGISFRPAYRQLGDLRRQLNYPPVIALTATASRSTQQYILQSLNMQDAKVIVTGFVRPNIQISIQKTFKKVSDKFEYIKQLISDCPDQKIIVFVLTIKHGKELQEYLQGKEVDVPFFHANLDSATKMRIQNLYTGVEKPELKVLISTSAFGMGIDIPNIRHVVHLSPALSLTDYVQQIGRAGRDNEEAYAHLLYAARDDGLLKYMVERPLLRANFQKENGYSDADMVKVKNKLLEEVDHMLELLSQDQGQEWQYIKDYFGETQFSSWQRYGKTISLVILVGLFIFFFMFLSLLINF